MAPKAAAAPKGPKYADIVKEAISALKVALLRRSRSHMGCWLASYVPLTQTIRAGECARCMAGCNALYGSHIHFLQERGGSSLPAIKKYVAEHYPSLPGPWEKTLSYQIKKMAMSGKLVKVKLHLSSDRCYMAQHLPLPCACLGALERRGASP